MLKAKQKTVSILLACLTMLAALVFGFVSFFKTPTTTASAATAYVETSFGEGKLLITTTFDGKTYYLPATTTSSAPVATLFTDVSKISEDHLWTVTATGSNYYIKNSSGKYLYATNTNNGVRVGNTQGSWTYNSSNNSFKYSTLTRYLGIYNAQDWRSYNSVTASNYKESSTSFKFYKVGDSTACAHENETWEITKAATCTTAGEKTFTCPDCDNVRTEVIPATEHANATEEITTPATCTEAGEKTITCPDCSYEKTEVIPALGHTYEGGKCTVCGAKEPMEQKLTLTFDNTAKRTEFSTTKQVWTENGVTLTNNKSSSKTDVANYADPVRFYANSQLIIECANMIKIEFTCSSDDYANALKSSIGATATVSGSVVTVEFSKANSYTISSLTAQVRMNSLTVYTNACSHDNTTTTTVDATCTENGSITVTCDDCGEIISTETIAATGHSLDEGVITTEPQVGVEGVKTYTCTICGHTETESIPALNATKYTLSYSVPNGVEAPDSVEIAKSETITLANITAPEGFTFLGWTSEECKETKTAPMYFKAESEYTLAVEDNVTLYALFTYSAGSGNFVKVTEAPADWSGEYLIVYEDNAKAYVFNATDAADGHVLATINDSTIAYSDALSAETVTIAAMTGGYSIKTKNGYIYGTSGSNDLNFDTTTKQLNTISVDAEGNLQIISNTSHLRFNSASNGLRFRYYKSSSYTGQKAICLYALDGATYYATDLSVKIDSASITVGDSLTVNYKVSMPAVYADAVMHFTLDGNVIEANATLVGTQYVFSLPVPPQAMADNIVAELYFGETIIASKATYSIQEYAQNKLNDADSSAELKRLVSDMLYYGAAAQTYKGYKTENLATTVENILPAEDTAPTEASKSTNVYNTEITEYPAYIISAGVYFDSVNQLYIKLNTIENVKVYVKIGDGEKTEANLTTGTTYYTDGISARGFATEYVFEVYHDGTLMQTLTYSVNAYAYAKQNDAKIGDLALALYRYGVSAAAYNA